MKKKEGIQIAFCYNCTKFKVVLKHVFHFPYQANMQMLQKRISMSQNQGISTIQNKCPQDVGNSKIC